MPKAMDLLVDTIPKGPKYLTIGYLRFPWTSKMPTIMDPILPILFFWDIGLSFWALSEVQVITTTLLRSLYLVGKYGY